jgi:iron complex transport system ATP-binding protein
MVRADNITFKLKSGRKILDNVSFALESSEICAVIGPNGAGKSTLMKVLNGIIMPSEGVVRIGSQKLNGLKRSEIAKMIAFLPQTTHAVPCRVYDSVLLGRKPYMSWNPKERDHSMAEDVMSEFGICEMRDKCVTELSGGEFQKTLIARAMVQNADILMLDEPINHLDVKNQVDIMNIAQSVTKRRNLATMIVMHDLNLAMRYADKILLMNNGKAVYWGRKEDLSEEHLSGAFGIDISVHRLNDKSVVLF